MMINCTKCGKEKVCKFSESVNEVCEAIIKTLKESSEKIEDKGILEVDVKCRYFDFAKPVIRKPITIERKAE